MQREHIPKPLRYSPLRGYHVELDNNDNSDNRSNPAMDNCNFTDISTTSCLLTLQSDRSYTLHVYAVTSQNQLSRNFSTITIPSLGEIVHCSAHVLVDYIHDIRSFGTPDVLDKPSWKELPADNTSYILDVKYDSNKGDNQEDFLVGVSRQVTNGVNITSSGIVWAKYSANITSMVVVILAVIIVVIITILILARCRSGRDVAKQAKDDVTAPLGNVNGYLSQEQSAAMAQSEKEAGKKSEDAARQKERKVQDNEGS
nr:hypothetical protein BaRGS_017016 [Batillaria attramentaria]